MHAKDISLSQIEKNKKEYLKSEKHAVARHALSKGDFVSFVSSGDEAQNHAFTFSLDLKTLPVTNQLHSGRCWIFSGCNVLREMVAKKAGIKDMFEISQNYISFYDKLEKINFTLESIISLGKEKADDRKMMFVLTNGVGDGGQWTMFTDLIKKYGVCPKAAYAETAQSNDTAQSNRVINTALRHFAYEMQKASGEDEIRALKESYMAKFYAFLCDIYGVPPTKFDFEYMDKNGTYHIEKDMTPQSFCAEYIGADIDEYVSVINAPTKDKSFNKTYQIELLGNVVGGDTVTHLNVSMGRLKEMIVSQLQAGDLVWFGSDVGKFGDRSGGIWDDKAFDYKTPFDLDFQFAKDGMLDYHDSAMNHAMVITGFDRIGEDIVRWKIENSWGEDRGQKGFYMMSDSFFDQFVYQAAIKKAFLNDDEKKALAEKPTVLPPWDPFGTLAD